MNKSRRELCCWFRAKYCCSCSTIFALPDQIRSISQAIQTAMKRSAHWMDSPGIASFPFAGLSWNWAVFIQALETGQNAPSPGRVGNLGFSSVWSGLLLCKKMFNRVQLSVKHKSARTEISDGAFEWRRRGATATVAQTREGFMVLVGNFDNWKDNSLHRWNPMSESGTWMGFTLIGGWGRMRGGAECYAIWTRFERVPRGE